MFRGGLCFVLFRVFSVVSGYAFSLLQKVFLVTNKAERRNTRNTRNATKKEGGLRVTSDLSPHFTNNFLKPHRVLGHYVVVKKYIREFGLG